MREIGNIFLCWRPGRGSGRIPVGKIKHSVNGKISFAYIEEGVKKAQNVGFQNYEGFPDVNKIYTENVLEIFGQRLIKSERSDTKTFYDFWGVDNQYKDNILYMLAYTQGLLPTDNFEFLADFNPNSSLSFISEITGLSEANLAKGTLITGDKLSYQLEPENTYDNNAVKVFYKEQYLGHVKLIHSRVFFKTKRVLPIKVHNIESNGVLKRIFIKIGNSIN